MKEKQPIRLSIKNSEATESFSRFSLELQQCEMLISYLEVSNQFIQKNKNEAKEYFMAIYDNIFNEEEQKKKLLEESDIFLNVEFYNVPLSSMIYVRTIDNFTTYFKEILSEIVMKKPQILKSQETEKLDFILEFESMTELTNAIAIKKIEDLFYKGIEDIEKFFKNRLGIDIFKNKEEKKSLNRLIKQRNLAVHNRRKISKEFAREFPGLGYTVGQYIHFQFDYVSKINLIVFNYIAKLDQELSEKFKLKKINLK